MNDLGWTLAWLVVQVTLLLVPTLALQIAAARRHPAAGAWVATWGLGLVVVLGGAAALPGGPMVREQGPGAGAGSVAAKADPATGPSPATGSAAQTGAADHSSRFSGWRIAWDRFGRRASGPAARVRPWGRVIAGGVLAGMGLGLVRLGLGLGAVAACRRRGVSIADPAFLELVAELHAALGCRRAVEVRMVPDLVTPATAGWRRPVLLLPHHWRSWTEAERRAVVAHELAHIRRGDYAAGVLARVAVVLHYHHPLVWWLNGRLHLDQELAADALASRFAGGRSAYLVALSSLALKQDGLSPSWPARAFLPARGTLIRRIAMLKLDEKADRHNRIPRLATAGVLLALAALAASWRGPALAQASDEPAAAPAAVPPVEVGYLSARATGVLAYRPALAARRPGMGRFVQLFRGEFGFDPDMISLQEMGLVIPPDAPRLRDEQIESVVVGFAIKPGPKPKDPAHAGEQNHALEIFGVTVRTVAPFDWLGFLRGMGLKAEEVHAGKHASYRMSCRFLDDIKMPLFAFLPDNRTLVLDCDSTSPEELNRREVPATPAYLRGADWARASQGVLAIAIDNTGDRFAKDYDLKGGRADDAAVLNLLRGVDRCVLDVADADPLALRVEATARDPEAASAAGRALDALVKQGQALLAADPAAPTEPDPGIRLAMHLLGRLKIVAAGSAVTVAAPDFGTDADLAAWLKRFEEAEARARKAAQPAASKP